LTCHETTVRITRHPEVHGSAMRHPQKVFACCIGQNESLSAPLRDADARPLLAHKPSTIEPSSPSRDQCETLI
jgi:hypothetical protein